MSWRDPTPETRPENPAVEKVEARLPGRRGLGLAYWRVSWDRGTVTPEPSLVPFDAYNSDPRRLENYVSWGGIIPVVRLSYLRNTTQF